MYQWKWPKATVTLRQVTTVVDTWAEIAADVEGAITMMIEIVIASTVIGVQSDQTEDRLITTEVEIIRIIPGTRYISTSEIERGLKAKHGIEYVLKIVNAEKYLTF